MNLKTDGMLVRGPPPTPLPNLRLGLGLYLMRLLFPMVGWCVGWRRLKLPRMNRRRCHRLTDRWVLADCGRCDVDVCVAMDQQAARAGWG